GSSKNFSEIKGAFGSAMSCEKAAHQLHPGTRPRATATRRRLPGDVARGGGVLGPGGGDGDAASAAWVRGVGLLGTRRRPPGDSARGDGDAASAAVA
ncbi:hypothetical protein GUJ93_ZPchr0005g15576, partial [Zizania palustris]